MTTKSMNGGARDPVAKRPPTDLELMLYADGELEGERLREVKLAVERDAALRSKLTALRLASDIVREDALAADVDLTDGIMARIAAASDTAERDPRDAAPASKVAEQRVPAKVEPLLQPGVGNKVAAKRGASNDNARGIFALTAVAVAAAAAMMVWGRIETAPTRPQEVPVAVAPNTQETAPAEPAPAAPAAAPSGEGESDVGVEVAAVDFGSRVGTIFYVPAEAAPSNHTTTVVWLADDPAGGEQ